jgi:hypothetical protein
MQSRRSNAGRESGQQLTKGSSRRNARRQDVTAELTAKIGKILNNLNANVTIMSRRLTTSGTIATNGAGAVALGTLASSAGVSSATDFATMGLLYSGYRVKGMRARVWPIYGVNVAGVAPPPSLVACSMFSSGQSVTNYANMLDSAGCKFFTGYKPATFAVTYDELIDAKLWTPTSAAISSTEAYGLVFIGASGNIAAQVTVVYWNFVIEYDTEFITAA